MKQAPSRQAPKELIGLTAPDTRASRATLLVSECAAMASLRVPPNIPHREAVVAEAALVSAFGYVIDASTDNGARPMHCLAALAVQRGRESGMAFSEILAVMQAAFMDAATSRAEYEAEGLAKESAT